MASSWVAWADVGDAGDEHIDEVADVPRAGWDANVACMQKCHR